MRETGSRMFDDFSRLMTDAAEVAHGVRREAETLLKGQVERLIDAMHLVTREEFEAVKEMAAKAREENDRLAQRIAALEVKLGLAGDAPAQPSDGRKPAD
jgi:BMFP domain-containing protein YqiC